MSKYAVLIPLILALGAQAAPHRTHLKPDITPADYQQRLRNVF